jgi:uncharacterized protein (TIGR03437 family)
MVTNSQVTVAIPQIGLLATFSSNGVRCAVSPLPGIINLGNLFSKATIFFSTRVTEGFVGAFLTKDAFSDTGTRIMVRYSNFPSGARLFVPDFVAGSSAITQTAGGDLGLAASGGQYAPSAAGSLLLIRVTGVDSNGAGGALAFPVPGMGTTSFNSASEVALANGAGNAVYEVVDSNPHVQESAQFPTLLGLAPFGNGAATVADTTVSFAPLSTVDVAAMAPIPRFADMTPPSDCSAVGDCNAAYFPKLNVDATPLAFSAQANALLQTQYVRVHNDGGSQLNWTATVIYQTGSGWLTVDPASGADNATIRVDAHPDKVPPGTYQATVTVDAGPMAGSRSIPVTFTVTSGSTPAGPTVSAIVNAASFQTGPLVAGSLATITGTGLTGSNVGVTFDGSPAKLLYTSSTQINLQVPSEIAGKTSAQAIMMVDGKSSAPQTVALAVAAPEIFGGGVLNQDNTLNSVSNPASLGSVIQIFATGLISPTSGMITASIQGREIDMPKYGGPAPGIPGVQQVNILIPADLAATASQLMVCALGSDPNQRVCSAPVSVFLK